MKKIALISDTHSFLGKDVVSHLRDVDEIWHAGDVGDPKMMDVLSEIKETKGVYGNIDGTEVRAQYPLNLIFECEDVKVLMTHIGGYPGRYTKRVKELLVKEKPQLYICGHSHICKVMRDKALNVLHMNPGACGYEGFHSFRTMLKFECSAGEILNLELVELGRRGKSTPSHY